MLIADTTPGNTTGGSDIGWDSNQSGAFDMRLRISGGALGGIQYVSSEAVIVGANTQTNTYKVAFV